GNDTFGVFHNLAPLDLDGGADDDTFIVRTFLLTDSATAIDGGGGADTISYAGSSPLTLNGGDGNDKLIVYGTETDHAFLLTATTIYGGGRVIVYAGLEQIELDTLQGDDLVVVHSTAAGVTTRIRLGLGGDRALIGGPIPAVNTGDATPVLPAQDPR